MEKILITGATGFIGKNLISEFLKRKKFIILAFVDKKDINGIDYLNRKGILTITLEDFEEFKGDIDYCVHLASYGVAYGARDIDTMIDVNIKLSAKILKFCSGHNCKLFLNTGSCFEYGTGISDRLIKENDRLNPNDIYAASKVSCEDFLNVYSQILNIKICTIRPFSIFGIYEPPFRLMPLVLSKGIKHETLDLTGGEQVRDYMDVRDVCFSIVELVMHNELIRDREAINICSGKPLNLKEFIIKICEACSFDIGLFNFGKLPYRKNESMYFAGDNSRLLSIIGEYDFSIKKERIVEIYNWFSSQI